MFIAPADNLEDAIGNAFSYAQFINKPVYIMRRGKGTKTRFTCFSEKTLVQLSGYYKDDATAKVVKTIAPDHFDYQVVINYETASGKLDAEGYPIWDAIDEAFAA